MARPYRRAGSLLLAALLAMGAAVTRRETHYELRVEISSSVSSQAQLFYNIGQGYREQDSATQATRASLGGEFQQLAFPLPTTALYALRFDPLNSAGHLVVKNIEVRTRRGTVFRFSPADLKAMNQIASVRTNDGKVEVTHNG